MLPLLPSMLFWANSGRRWHDWLWSPWAPLPDHLSSCPLLFQRAQGEDLSQIRKLEGDPESVGMARGRGRSPRRAGSRGKGLSLPGWVGVEARGTGPPGEAKGGETPSLLPPSGIL